MGGYEITRFSENVQKLIRENKIDKNNDGLINEDNDELSELLSQTGKTDVRQLNKFDSYFLWPGMLGSSGLLAGAFYSFKTQVEKNTPGTRNEFRSMVCRPDERVSGIEVEKRVDAVMKKYQNFKPAKRLFVAGTALLAATLTCAKIFGIKYAET